MEFEKVKVGLSELNLEKRGAVCEVPKKDADIYDMEVEDFFKTEVEAKFKEIKNAKIFRLRTWMEPFEEELGEILECIIKNKELFNGIEEFQIGLMPSEECDLSCIYQVNYSKFLDAFKGIKKLVLAGGVEKSLRFGRKISHDNLEELEVVSGGMDKEVLEDIASADFPKLKSLILYLGMKTYGNTCSDEDIINLIKSENVKKVEKLGLMNDEDEDRIVKILFEDGHIDELENLKKLNISHGLLTAKGAKILLESSDRVEKLEELNIERHGILDESLIKKLQEKYPNAIVGEKTEEYDDDDGEIYFFELPVFGE